MAFWCYILRCSDGLYYTGHTDDLERRLAQHHHGGFSKFTSSRRPVTLIWAQDFPTRHEALATELRVKNWSRAKKEALARSDWASLSHFAKPPSERSTGTPPEGVSTSLDTNGDGEQ
jgi:predicted GIY-YIG superfamily endonuclease